MPQGAGAPPESRRVRRAYTNRAGHQRTIRPHRGQRHRRDPPADRRHRAEASVPRRRRREGRRTALPDRPGYQASFDSASATLAKAEANVATARLKAQRYQELIADKAVSQQAADDAKESKTPPITPSHTMPKKTTSPFAEN